MVALAIVFITLLGIKLFWDTYNRKVRKRVINHGVSSLIDGSIYAITIYFFICTGGCTEWYFLGWLILTASLRWLLFDLLFAKVNYGKWIYYGKSAWLDIQLTKLGKWHFVPKLIILIIGIILIII